MKTVEVTFSALSSTANVYWVDASNEVQETRGKTGTIYPIAGSIIVMTVGAKGITNASEITQKSPYIYQVDA